MKKLHPSHTQPEKLGLSFHRTFFLDRFRISQVLQIAHSNLENSQFRSINWNVIRNETHLGTVQSEAMPRYAQGCGLLTKLKRVLTPFGKLVQQFDPLLEKMGTQWLMHYYMSVEHGPGPAFWHELVSSRFQSGNRFTRAEIMDQIQEFVLRTQQKSLSMKSSIGSTATVFLGSYLKSSGLGSLHILDETGKGQYEVLDPEPPSAATFGVALIDYWTAHFGDRLTVNLETLSEEGGLAGLFLMGAGQLGSVLYELQEEGYVEVYRVAPPYQVALLRRDSSPLLEKMYAIEPTF